MQKIEQPAFFPATLNYALHDWTLSGPQVVTSLKTLGQMRHLFQEEQTLLTMDQGIPVYQVQVFQPQGLPQAGGLCIGNTTVFPGKVGCEYFMTRGHFHALADRTEYYWVVQGEGILLLMNETQSCRAEKMIPGSIHFIEPRQAHRVVNTGDASLIFGACWPSDAGHQYDIIDQNGFSCRILDKDGTPWLQKI